MEVTSRKILLAGSVIAIVLIAVLFSGYYLQTGGDEPLEDEPLDKTSQNEGEPQDQNTSQNTTSDDTSMDEITLVSWNLGWELITCLPRETGETNYDLEGFLNATVDNPTADRVRISLIVRYAYSFNYTLWGELRTLHNSHKRTVSQTIYEYWERPYQFTLFYQPFDADNPPNLQILHFDAEILEVAIPD